MIELPQCVHRVRVAGGMKFCMSPQACGELHRRPPTPVAECIGCGFDKGQRMAAPSKPRVSIDELARRRRSCKEKKARGEPCPYEEKPKMLTWAYGITTVKKRAKLLERTIASLAGAGFPEPHVFADDYVYRGPHNSTSRSLNLKVFGNWLLGLAELYIREPRADRFAMFQDDAVACRSLRTYLERWYPSDGYLNLALYPCNSKQGARGWYRAMHKGQGAQGLVFSRDAALKLLYSPYLRERPLAAGPRAWKYLDGGIEGAMRTHSIFEYVHSPSLVGHTGSESTIGNSPQPHIAHSEAYDPCSETK